jgi:anti-sigma B factor antagonist
MSLVLVSHAKGKVMIVQVSGKLTLGEGTSALREQMRELAMSGPKRILLDMSKVTYIDSSGLGELVAAHTTLTNAGCEMKLLNLAKRTHDLMEITRLYTVFETFEDEASAIGSFVSSEGD